MKRKKLTVYDYLKCKGKRQLSVLFVHNVEEARAAEEAGIDMICTSHDAPQFGVYTTFEDLKRIREAAPSCFMQSGGAVAVASEYEAMKLSHKYMNIGADVIYGGNWSNKWVRALRAENIPINSHVGLIPGKATWIGGYRAIGKTAEEAYELFQKFKRLEDAGAFSAECEVIPENVMGEISKRTDIVTVSLGSGKNADVMYLFMEDICGDTENPPRHSKAYGNLLKLRNEIKLERVKALKAFKKDSMNGKFPGKKQSSNLDKTQFEKFLDQLD